MKAATIITKNIAINPVNGKPHGNSKPVFCITTGEVFASTIEAAKKLGVHNANISYVCNGKQHTVKNMRFCYVADMTANLLEIATHIQDMRKDFSISEQQELRRRAEEAEKRAAKYENILRSVAKAIEW